MSGNIALIHKNCFDGNAAGLIFHRKFPKAEILEWEYGDPVPTYESFRDRGVYLLDLTMDTEVIEAIAEYAAYVTIIDHHPKALRQAESGFTRKNIHIVTPTGGNTASGAMLALRYFFGTIATQIEWISWIDQRDRWAVTDERAWTFAHGLGTLGLHWYDWVEYFGLADLHAMFSPVPREGLHPKIQTLLDRGQTIAGYREQNLQYFLDNCRTTLEICGHHVPAFNAPKLYASDLAARVYSNEDVPFVAVYYDEHGKRVYSLRSRKGGVDVGKICESLGGGGHPNAAGFKVTIHRAPLESTRDRVTSRTSKTFFNRLKNALMPTL